MAGGSEKSEFRGFRNFTWIAVLIAGTWACDGGGERPDPLPAGMETTGDGGSSDDEPDTPDDTSDDEPADPSTTGSDDSSGDEPDDPSGGGSTGEPGGTTGGDEPDIVYTGPGCGITPTCDKGEYVGSIRIESSDQIDDIAGYTSITGWLEVNESDLECLDFLYCMETVGRNMSIFGNAQLKDTRGLDNLTALGTSTTELGYDQWDGSLVISNNPGLVVINGFNSLVETQESLNINRNDFLERIEGFESFLRVQHNLVVRDNPVLHSIEGLTGLETVGGSFLVTQNPSLCLSEINILGASLLQTPGDGGTTAANNEGC
jgi:hypothetical protein